MALLCLLILGAAAAAQGKAYEATYEVADGRIEGDEYIQLLVGNVTLRTGDMTLRADNIVVWVDRSSLDRQKSDSGARLVAREVYADGTVLLQSGNETIRAHAVYFDFANDQGLVVEASLGLDLPPRGRSNDPRRLSIRAAEIRQVATNHWEAWSAVFSPCVFAHPHLHVTVDRLEAILEPPIPRPGGKPGETMRNVRLRTDNAVLRQGSIPVFWLPPFTTGTASTEAQLFHYVKDVSYDNSRRFGPTAILEIGDDILLDNGETRWGEWTATFAWRSRRGPGFGLDVAYADPDYRGRFRGNYQKDDGEDLFTDDLPAHNRGRVRWQHRHRLPWDVQMDIEVAAISDRGYLFEYLEDELKSDKEQETLVYFKKVLENHAFTALYKTRINSFEDEIEYMPHLGYNLISEPVLAFAGGDLYLEADFEITNVRKRFDRAKDLPSERIWRADFDTRLAFPFFAGPVKIEPSAGVRWSRFGEGVVRKDPIDRVGGLAGIRFTTELSRTFDVSGGFFELDGLRHIVLPEISFLSIFGVSEGPDELIPFDAVESFDDWTEIRFGIRNRLQTRWYGDSGPRVVDFLDLDVELPVYPDADRDNGGETFGPVDLDLVLRLSPHVTVLCDFEYAFDLDEFEVFNGALGWVASAETQAYIGLRHFEDVNTAVIAQLNHRFSEKWAVSLGAAYDFQEDEFLDTKVVVRRIGHDWVFEIGVKVDVAEDETSVFFSLIPRFLFDNQAEPRQFRREPRFLDTRDAIFR